MPCRLMRASPPLTASRVDSMPTAKVASTTSAEAEHQRRDRAPRATGVRARVPKNSTGRAK